MNFEQAEEELNDLNFYDDGYDSIEFVDDDEGTPPRRNRLGSCDSVNINKREVKLIEENVDYRNEKTIQVRKEDEAKPMPGHRRKITEVKMMIDDIFDVFENEEDKEKKDIPEKKEYDKEDQRQEEQTVIDKQYTLTTKRKAKSGLLLSLLSCLGLYSNEYGAGQNSERNIITYLHWTFKASFLTLFSSFLGLFMFLILIFAGLIELAAVMKPQCITPSSGSFENYFALSWTTFSTVGYGHTFPSLASQEDQIKHCTFITFITAMESFVGVLYAGFCGAIIFGKVLRIQSQAQVVFTDPILIRFGKAAKVKQVGGFKDIDSAFPVLEFRIYNRDYHKVGSEIINTSLRCLVVNAESMKNSPRVNSARRSLKNAGTEDIDYSYSHLKLDLQEHPFFKRRWIARHVLDENSPLLISWAKRLIKINGGRWPEELNSYQNIRKSVKFDQIVVNLAGTSNFSATPVFAQKVYEDFDVSIGYEFVNIVYKDRNTKKMMLDLNMINDVVEQTGGGGEPLGNR